MLKPDHGRHYHNNLDVLAAWLRGDTFLDTLANAKVSKELAPRSQEIRVTLGHGRRPVVLVQKQGTWSLKEKP